MNSVLWIIFLVVFLIIEALTVNLVTTWFAIGSLGAIVVASLGAEMIWQIVTFLCVSALALVIARPIIKKHIKTKAVPTNADRVIGETGIVTDDITSDKFAGQVSIAGREWSAVSDDHSAISVGTRVIVKEISGVKLIVEKEKGE